MCAELPSCNTSMHADEIDIELLKVKYTEVVDSLFSKHIRLKPLSVEDDCDECITNEEFVSQLQDLSSSLNNLRAKIPRNCLDDWRRHTAFTHPLGSCIREQWRRRYGIEYSTQAFFKFYEILTRFSNLCFRSDDKEHNIRSLHLCESPGAFISALNVYLKLQKSCCSWFWKANSLNPHYEWNCAFDMFLDDELITSTQSNWLFGPDNSGDIFKWTNDYVSNVVAKIGKFHLITADGSEYCQESPAEQERTTFPLLQKQVDVSLVLLQAGGTLILKMYTSFLAETVALMHRLLECFNDIHVVKPSCSKPGNSEIYLLCAGYMQQREPGEYPELSANYQKILLKCSKFFAENQMRMIEFNVASFDRINEIDDFRDFIEQKKLNAAEIYEQKMGLSDFSKFVAELSTVSFTRRKRPNPWNFSKLSGFIEGLRNVTTDEVRALTEDMVIHDIISGDNSFMEQKFDISPCCQCDCCQWIDDFCMPNSSRNLDDILETGCAPSVLAAIKHTLFLEPKTMALLKCTCLDIQDMCQILETNIAVVAEFESIEMQSGTGIAEDTGPSFLRSQLDWIFLLETMFRHASKYKDSTVRLKEIPLNSLILTRFAVSFLSCCAVLYKNVSLLCPEKNSSGISSTQLICSNPRNNGVHHCPEFYHYLSIIREMLTDVNSSTLQFYTTIDPYHGGCCFQNTDLNMTTLSTGGVVGPICARLFLLDCLVYLCLVMADQAGMTSACDRTDGRRISSDM